MSMDHELGAIILTITIAWVMFVLNFVLGYYLGTYVGRMEKKSKILTSKDS